MLTKVNGSELRAYLDLGRRVTPCGEANVNFTVNQATADVLVLIVPNESQAIPVIVGKPFTEEPHIMIVRRRDTARIFEEKNVDEGGDTLQSIEIPDLPRRPGAFGPKIDGFRRTTLDLSSSTLRAANPTRMFLRTPNSGAKRGASFWKVNPNKLASEVVTAAKEKVQSFRVNRDGNFSGSQVIQWKSTYNPLLDVTTVSDMAMSPNRAMDNSVARSVPERMITKTALRGIIQNVQTAMETT
ncbi:hypothetical protein HPB52_024275 [Rhipicephalus sanguineus]|uniref:Uncharacterized protein n=1 Tax=Rhipicephalus sanguineus TaxID=34632 RepID=A0A9D4TCG8_RHISA|nr:hypothetical protein HPB52_024275 [Rhipicephalus sanguineus]